MNAVHARSQKSGQPSSKITTMSPIAPSLSHYSEDHSIISRAKTNLANFMRRLLHNLSQKLDAPNIIFDHEGTQPYLSRYYLFRGPKSNDGWLHTI
jgi:hypothetical protein